MAKENPFVQFIHEMRFLSYSYNFERDHALKNARLIAGGLLFVGGVLATALRVPRDLLTPWVTGSMALAGAFLMLTADDTVLANRDIVAEPIPPQMLEQARTTGIYGGFGIEGDADEYFLYSRSVNRLLMTQDLFTTLDPKPFALDPQLRRLAPYVMSTTPTPKGKRLFNREVRLASDIVETVFRSESKVLLQPTDYVSSVCTNDLALTMLKQRDTGKILLNGLDLVLEDRVVRSLDRSRCANLIGINALVVLSDGHYLVRQQTKPYAANLGQLVPFISASFSLDDYTASLSLQQMLARALTQRLCEETGYAHPERIRTAVVGYARLLPRGGKPEFLGIMTVEERLEDFLGVEAIRKHGLSIPYPVQSAGRPNLIAVEGIARAFNEAHEPELSIQLRATVHALGLAMKEPQVRSELARGLGL